MGADLKRATWLATLHRWHWISSALCLVGMLLFALTGLTLNNARHIGAKPVVSTKTGRLPSPLLTGIGADRAEGPLPAAIADWIADQLKIDLGGGPHDAEWSPQEVYVSLPRPGGDAWLRIERSSGAVEYERTDRGWISYLNDLHKGRHTGAAWSWFLDLFSLACLVFAITGLLILKMHAANRPTTWPIVAAGLVAPLLLALLLIH